MPDLLKNSINFLRPPINFLTFLFILESLEKSIYTSEHSDILDHNKKTWVQMLSFRANPNLEIIYIYAPNSIASGVKLSRVTVGSILMFMLQVQ